MNRYRRNQVVEYAVGVLTVVGTLVAVTAVLTVAGRIVVGDGQQASDLPSAAEAEAAAVALFEAVDNEARRRIDVASVVGCDPVDDRFLCRVTATEGLGVCLAALDEEPVPGDRVRALCSPS